MTPSTRRVSLVGFSVLLLPLYVATVGAWHYKKDNEPVTAPRYELTDIGNLGGAGVPLQLNDRGQVLGTWKSVTSKNYSRLFVWKSGKFQYLQRRSLRPCLNNRGEVYGSRYEQPTFRWKNGQITLLPAFQGDIDVAAANDQGQLVGLQRNSSEDMLDFSSKARPSKPVLTGTGEVAEISTPKDEKCFPKALNNRGEVLLESDKNIRFWSNGETSVITELNDIASNEAVDLNNQGVVAGYSSDGTATWSWTWQNGQLTNLSSQDGNFTVRSINDHSAIVGSSRTSQRLYAALYLNDQLLDLNQLTTKNSGWKLIDTIEINNCNQILAKGLYHGRERYCLLTPITAS